MGVDPGALSRAQGPVPEDERRLCVSVLLGGSLVLSFPPEGTGAPPVDAGAGGVSVAALGMYDWPEVRSETDALWSRLAAGLRAAGVAAPDDLTRPAERT